MEDIFAAEVIEACLVAEGRFELVEWHWPDMISFKRTEHQLMLEMSLPPMSADASAYFPDIDPERRCFMGALFVRHPGIAIGGRSEDELLSGFNQLWRRNIKKSAKLGVVVELGGVDDLPAFHALYLETAERDGFIGRPLSYFQQMWAAMNAEDPDRLRLYLARHEGDLVAATTLVRVGEHAWYSYGASSTEKRDVRGSNAIQWQMMRDSAAAGATVYDLRGITDTLDSSDSHFGLIQFKLGTGGEAVEYVGEWDLPLNRLLYKAFDVYMSRR